MGTEAGNTGTLSVLSAQFCYESKSALKKGLLILKHEEDIRLLQTKLMI